MASVEVLIFSFNHEDFVTEALNSVIMQETQHKVSIRLHDDASTDSTVKKAESILKASGSEYRIQQHKSNKYQNGMNFFYEAIKESSADYIAFLDADDFWTDSSKIEKQVGLLEANSKAALCNHEFQVQEDTKLKDSEPNSGEVRIRLGVELSRENFIGTSTVVLRRRDVPESINQNFNELKIGDYVIWALASDGKEIVTIEKMMSTYRIHPGSVHSSLPRQQKIWNELEARFFIAQNVDQMAKQSWLKEIENFIYYHHPLRLELTKSVEESNRRLVALETSLTWRSTAWLRALINGWKI